MAAKAPGPLVRSMRVIARPVTWPLNKLVWIRVRRDPKFAAMYLGMQVDLCSRELGPSHRLTLRNLTDHAIALSKLGDLRQAEAELTEVITRLNERGDGDARLLLAARMWHHDVLRRLGWASGREADARLVADSYARQDSCARRLGPDHPDTLNRRELTAEALWEAGRHAEAMAEISDVAARRAATQGASHPDTLITRSILAGWSGKAGDASEARDQFAALLPIRERVLGPEHPNTLTTRSWLARWTGEAGDAAGARDQFAALLQTDRRVLGPEHPDTLNARGSLARWTGKAGDAASARDQFAALLPIEERVLGPEHPDTLDTRHNLANYTGEAGDPARARDEFAALLPIRERVQGPDHPHTVGARASLAHWTERARTTGPDARLLIGWTGHLAGLPYSRTAGSGEGCGTLPLYRLGKGRLPRSQASELREVTFTAPKTVTARANGMRAAAVVSLLSSRNTALRPVWGIAIDQLMERFWHQQQTVGHRVVAG